MISRFQPIKLSMVAHAISTEWRRIAVLRLCHTYFPEAVRDIIPIIGWIDALRYFLAHIDQAGWFEPDWRSLNQLIQFAYEDYPESEEEEQDPDWEPDAFGPLADAFSNIPVEAFGLYDALSGPVDMASWPPLLLLNCLCYPDGFNLEKNFPDLAKRSEAKELRTIKVGLPSEIGQLKQIRKNIQETNYRRTQALDLTRLEYPINLLPEITRYACGKTGNPLMDNSSNFENWSGFGEDWYSWDTDLDQLKGDWQMAQAMLGRIEAFLMWADSENELEVIFDLVTGVTNEYPER